MRKIMMSLLCAVFAFGLVSCASDGTGVSKQGVGTVTGAAAGGLIGSTIGGGSGRTVAIIGGALLGGYIGGSIGKSMDDVDRMKYQRALEYNRTGQSARWSNPDTGNSYVVTPTNTTHRGDQACREYTTTANIGGKTEKVHGTACRQSDGSWKTVS